jgi:hypothetical protein
MDLNGNYRVHCPNCGHIHYRVVENGKITVTRFNDRSETILIEDIIPMKASCRDFRKTKAEDCYEYATDLKQDGPKAAQGFLRRLWQEKFSVEI